MILRPVCFHYPDYSGHWFIMALNLVATVLNSDSICGCVFGCILPNEHSVISSISNPKFLSSPSTAKEKYHNHIDAFERDVLYVSDLE